MLAHTATRPSYLTGAGVDRPVLDYRWSKDGGLLAIVEDGSTPKFVAFTPEGALREVAAISANPKCFRVSDSARVAFAGKPRRLPRNYGFGPEEPHRSKSLT